MKSILLALALTASAPPQQFDLICTSKSEQIRYRVDLQSREWCWESCSGTWRIADVTSTKIIFKDETSPGSEAYAAVDRVSGAWSQYSRDAYGSFLNQGTCTPAPFSGFGAERIKF